MTNPNKGNDPVKLRKALREVLDFLVYQCDELPDIDTFDGWVRRANWKADEDELGHKDAD